MSSTYLIEAFVVSVHECKVRIICEYLSDGDLHCVKLDWQLTFLPCCHIVTSSTDRHVPKMSLLFFGANCALTSQIMKLSILICQI